MTLPMAIVITDEKRGEEHEPHRERERDEDVERGHGVP